MQRNDGSGIVRSVSRETESRSFRRRISGILALHRGLGATGFATQMVGQRHADTVLQRLQRGQIVRVEDHGTVSLK